ncbi:MAG TPA: hypothetical protein VED46_12920 [Alphaproteobacteria bacterium]|nr:hypothetical protein [Alphaproteobacteria bacterium]
MAADLVQAPHTQAWKLYVAAGIGGFMLGIGDYLRHGNQSTVIALEKMADEVLRPVIGLDLLLAVLLLLPFLGVIAAWIQKPLTERDAFALGLAAFSLFALVPSAQPAVGAGTISVSSAEAAPLRLVAPAHAEEPAKNSGAATVNLHFAGARPPVAEVSITNLTTQQGLGFVAIQDSLKLVGKKGDLIELDIEAAGHRRTKIKFPLGETETIYEVNLQENQTPIFLQRLFPADSVRPILKESLTNTLPQ